MPLEYFTQIRYRALSLSMETETKNEKIVRIIRGTVVSDKMKDTIVVAVNRLVKHPKYKKYIRVTKRYKTHDVGNTKHIGDTVDIIECRPISRDKHYSLHS